MRNLIIRIELFFLYIRYLKLKDKYKKAYNPEDMVMCVSKLGDLSKRVSRLKYLLK